MSPAVAEVPAASAAGRRRPSAAIASSLALMGSAIGSGLLTFAFWTVLARTRGAAVVGSASGEVSTVTFLAGVGSLNMIGVFARFLPLAGDRARRFILTCYGAAALAGLAAGAVFLLTPWSHRLVLGGVGGRIGFVALVVCVSVFMIQDGGLVGFGRSLWVPIENVTVGVLRLAALPLLVVAGGALGAVGAWAGATVVAVGAINLLLVVRLAGAQRHIPSTLPPARSVAAFVAVDSVTTAVSSSVTAFLPAIVEHVRGATATGYFYVPWLIATTVSLLLMAILISMVRELAAARGDRVAVVRGQLRLIGVILGGVMVVCCVDPSLVLDILGSSFGRHGGMLLRWVGFSVPATAAALLYWSFCLLDRRPWPIFAMNVSNAVLVITGVVLLGRRLPITDIGLLYCGVQWAIALAVAAPLTRRVRRALTAEPEPEPQPC